MCCCRQTAVDRLVNLLGWLGAGLVPATSFKRTIVSCEVGWLASQDIYISKF